jgi:hypothetical protein
MAAISNIEQEILDWFNNEYEYKEDYVDEGEEKAEYFSTVWPAFNEEIYGDGIVELASGTAKTVDSYGGEGKGDTYWVVFQVGDKFYRVDGYYSSWEGTNWDSAEPYEVKPVEVTVIKYKKV